MASGSINENDYDSPGYEFLRLHRTMMNLYYKLVALDYQRDFCPVYKCPSINRYYFSAAQTNSFEQQFLFISLSAWLIRDKCQMNFEMELEDVGSSISVIFEALKVLHDDTELDPKFHIRLEQGYGPEVVYALSCFADRALELAQEHDPQLGSSPDIRFHNRQHDQNRAANSITIGQPIVGGTLTTRSLGKYLIEDSSLVLDYQGANPKEETANASNAGREDGLPTAEDWNQQVDKIVDLLTLPDDGLCVHEDWQEPLRVASESKRAIWRFLCESKSMLGSVESRINRQLQVVVTREKFLQTNLQTQIGDFLKIWRDHAAEAAANKQLLQNVNEKTDTFESYNARLKLLAGDINLRVRELSDGSKLKELESIITSLDSQSDELDVRVGLLMAALSKDA